MSEIKAISRCLGQAQDGSVRFFCPGCNAPHSINVNSPNMPGPNWGYNGNPDAPTFTPSVLARTTGAPEGRAVMTAEEEAEYDAIYARGGGRRFTPADSARYATHSLRMGASST